MVSKVWGERRDGQLSKVRERQEGWSVKKSLGERGGVVSKVWGKEEGRSIESGGGEEG